MPSTVNMAGSAPSFLRGDQPWKLKTILLTAAIGAGALAGFAAPALADAALATAKAIAGMWIPLQPSQHVRYDHHPDDWYFHRHWEDRDKACIGAATTKARAIGAMAWITFTKVTKARGGGTPFMGSAVCFAGRRSNFENGERTMKIRSLVLSAAPGVGALMTVAAPASAYVNCNRYGSCWHSNERYEYRPAFGVTIHDDS